ncbi:MFS transporter [Brevibacillus laterosporus]|uniref:MFS transporter n=1 Tax=Brevibacillus laterosporus TaxID=1465 RepID=UPI000EAC0ADB|nr:MFS transporter [Brevibacillus laterosporus]AYK06530.1 MFS transporter [Brevibacillus laterosporus]
MLTKQVRFLWVGQMLANAGDVFYIISLLTLVFEKTHSAVYTGFVPLTIILAQTVSGFLAPLMQRRFSLSTLLFLSQFAKTILLGLLVFVTQWSALPLLFSLGLASFISFLDGWATPARNALLPRIAQPVHLLRLNSLFATTDQVIQFVGWALGGMLVAFLGITYLFAVSLGLFILSTVCMAYLHDPIFQATTRTDSSSNKEALLRGWNYILRSRALFTLTCMDVLESLAGAIYVAAIMLFYVSDVLGKGQEWWGYLNASYFVGMIAGGLLLAVIATHVSRHFLSFLLGAGLFSALVTLGLGVTHSAWVALFLSFLSGPATQIQYVSKQTYFQRNVDSLYLPNVLSAKSTVEYVGYGLSVLILTNVVAVYGAAMAYIAASGILLTSLLLGFIMRRAFKIELGKLNGKI